MQLPGNFYTLEKTASIGSLLRGVGQAAARAGRAGKGAWDWAGDIGGNKAKADLFTEAKSRHFDHGADRRNFLEENERLDRMVKPLNRRASGGIDHYRNMRDAALIPEISRYLSDPDTASKLRQPYVEGNDSFRLKEIEAYKKLVDTGTWDVIPEEADYLARIWKQDHAPRVYSPNIQNDLRSRLIDPTGPDAANLNRLELAELIQAREARRLVEEVMEFRNDPSMREAIDQMRRRNDDKMNSSWDFSKRLDDAGVMEAPFGERWGNRSVDWDGHANNATRTAARNRLARNVLAGGGIAAGGAALFGGGNAEAPAATPAAAQQPGFMENIMQRLKSMDPNTLKILLAVLAAGGLGVGGAAMMRGR